MSAVIAGAMLIPGDAGDWVGRLRLPNAARAAWLRHGKGPEPDAWLSPTATMDGGPYAGGAAIPRCAPGVYGVDRRTLPEAAAIAFAPVLRPYQTAALAAVLDHYSASEGATGATIVAPCGAGKTMIGCALMAEIATPALVLVHTRDLAHQWVDRVRTSLGVEPAVVGYGKGDDTTSSRVVIASLQTLARWGWWRTHQWARQFGVAILDECHHMPAQTFCTVAAALPARVRVGLTATPTRADGLSPWVEWVAGPIVATIDPAAIELDGSILAPAIRRVHGPDVDLDGLESHERDRALAESDDRNVMIVDETKHAVDAGRRVLVLVKLVDHAYTLSQAMRDAGIESHALVGERSPTDRKSIIAAMRDGTAEAVIATTIADEGLDVPRLDTVILAHPCGDVARVEQRIGRVCRPHRESMSPLVIDIVDPWGPLQGYARRRSSLYRSRGWESRQ